MKYFVWIEKLKSISNATIFFKSILICQISRNSNILKICGIWNYSYSTSHSRLSGRVVNLA